MAKTPAPETVVSMTDGRLVTFTGRKRLDKTLITEPSPGVRLDFLNGETRTFLVPAELLNHAAAHGVSQKLGDEISDITDIEDAIEAVDQLMARLAKGEWRAKAEGGAGGMAGASILAKALVKVTGQPIAVVREYLSSLDNRTKAALRASAEVGPTVQRLEAEKAARAAARGVASPDKPHVDVSAVLAGIGQAA